MIPSPRICRLTLGGVLLLFLSWLAGFGAYLQDIRAMETTANPSFGLSPRQEQAAQTAIVVLTGGGERVAAGLMLLQRKSGAKLFISGAGASLPEILGDLPHDAALAQCCISLGREAGDTIGNARESLAWLRQQGLRRMILVTAQYHIRRSEMEFRLLAPSDLDIIPYPVATARVQIAGWWQRPRTALLLLTEYSKFLIALLRYGLGITA